jgi:hypothetical protein
MRPCRDTREQKGDATHRSSIMARGGLANSTMMLGRGGGRAIVQCGLLLCGHNRAVRERAPLAEKVLVVKVLHGLLGILRACDESLRVS